MRAQTKNLMQSTIVVGALILAAATATPSLGGAEYPLVIRSIAIHGNEVAITVWNPGCRTQSGIVVSRVVTTGGEVTMTAPVSVAAGQSTGVRLELAGPVLSAQPLGVVVDDGVPM